MWLRGNYSGLRGLVTPFKGFLYSPWHGVTVVWVISTSSAKNRPTSNVVVVKEGNVGQHANKSVVIHVAGYYYLALTCTESTSEPRGYYTNFIDTDIAINNIDMGLLLYSNYFTRHQPVTRERASLVSLKVYTYLHLVLFRKV